MIHLIPAPAVVTVGDELILGELANGNLQWMLQWLKEQGQPAGTAITLPDHVEVIGNWLRKLREDYSPILVSGGIGGTHDDCTRAGIARALDVPLVRHRECYGQLKEKYQDRLNEARSRMADLPEGASLIPNTHGAPGFYLQNIFAFPGFPSMLQEMVPQTLDLWTLPHAQWAEEEEQLEIPEGDAAAAVETFSRAWPSARLGIYADSNLTLPRKIKLRLRYPATEHEVHNAFATLVQRLRDESSSRTS
jgi:molybdenum cofactor synthesis domain-containing protein